VCSGVTTAVEVDGAGDKWSRDTTTVEMQTLLETVLSMSLRAAFLIKELSACKNRNLSLGTAQVPDLDCQHF